MKRWRGATSLVAWPGHLLHLHLLALLLARGQANPGLELRQRERVPHPHRLIALSRARRYWPAGTVVYLSDTALTLDAIVDDVGKANSNYSEVLSGIHADCTQAASTTAARIDAHTAKVAELERSKLLSLATRAEKEAELDALANKESAAQESYDSTVAQRANEGFAFSEEKTSQSQQKDVLSQVLTMLQQKRETMLANASSAGSELDYIIGVFSGMVDSTGSNLDEASTEHEKRDQELSELVTSTKASLQNLNEQYKAENAAKLAAEAAAGNAAREISLRKQAIEADTAAREHFWDFCGSGSGYGGSVHSAETVTTDAFNKFESQGSQTLNLMNDIIDMETTTSTTTTSTTSTSTTTTITTTTTTTVTMAAFLQIPSQLSVVLRGLAPSTATATPDKPLRKAGLLTRSVRRHAGRRRVALEKPSVGSPAWWAVLAKADGQHPGLLQSLARVLPNRSFLDIRREAAGVHGQNASASNETFQDCAKQKKDLTSRIVASRQLARTARSKVALLDARISAIAPWEEMMQSEVDAASATLSAFIATWEKLKQDEQMAHTELELVECQSDLAEVKKNVTNYAGLEMVKGSVLPSMVSSMETKLASLRDNVKLSTKNLLADYAEAETQLTQSVQTLTAEKENLQGELAKLNENRTAAAELLQEQEDQEKDLLEQREQVEAECEEAFQ